MSPYGPLAELSTPLADTGVYLKGGALKSPVFHLPSGPFSPMHQAPWINSGEDVEGLLRNLQGDFFCAPFGANATPVDGVQHPIHGFCSHGDWELLEHEGPGLKARFSQPGLSITKEVWLDQGSHAICQVHTLHGEGTISYGHHAMLQTGGKNVAWWTSAFGHGQVFPDVFEGPETQGRQALKPGARFDDFSKVPGLSGDYDLTLRPHKPGHEDLCQVFADPALAHPWHAALFPGEPSRLWVSVRDRSSLPSTVIWMSEGGRDYHPWNGRHTGVLALEDVCSHFHYGLAESRHAHSPARPTVGSLDDGPIVTRTAMTVLDLPEVVSRVDDVCIGGGVLTVHAPEGRFDAHFPTAMFGK